MIKWIGHKVESFKKLFESDIQVEGEVICGTTIIDGNISAAPCIEDQNGKSINISGADGLGTDKTGGGINIKTGQSTGNAHSNDIDFFITQISGASSGSTLQNNLKVASIDGGLGLFRFYKQIYSEQTDGQEDLKIVSSADTGDYFSISTTTHGATTIQTVDDNDAAAHLELAADGDITLDAAGQIKLEPGTSVLWDSLALTGIQASDESFSDDDISLMTSASINDRIESFGYITSAGDITSVVAGTNITGGGTSGDVTLNVPTASTTTKGAVELATTAEVTTGTDADRVVTPDGLKDGYQGSANIVTVGTIATGTWNADVIPSAKLDADTAHLSISKQFTYYMMVDDIDTTKIYIPLQTPDTETSVATNKQLRFLAPVAGKLLKVFLRANTNLSSNTLTWTLETRSTSLATSGTPTVVGTQSGAGCTNKTLATYDFTTGLDSGDNIIDAGDTVQLAVQSDSTTANSQYYITCLWEWDLS